MDMTNLKIKSVKEIATEIFEFVLVHPGKQKLPEFTAGAHVHVTVPSGGTRQYSLCNDPIDRSQYVIAVKRENEGKGGSVSLIDTASSGDLLEVSLPVNDFEISGTPERIILIAGGIGITPIVSMARTLLRNGNPPFHLYYLTRSPDLTAYRSELETGALNEFVTIHHDHGDPENSLDLVGLLKERNGAEIYCCGPTGLLHAVKAATEEWKNGTVHFEDFGITPDGSDEISKPFWLVISGSDARHLVPPDKTILQVLQENGYDMPSSCEAGTCGTCRIKLLEGVADHRDLVLFDDEMDDNIIICCSRAISDEITISIPE